MRQISIYIASKRRHAESLKAKRPDGVHFCARWLDMANLAANAAKPASHWQRENFQDIRDAEAVLVYAEKGERLVNALLEVGYAIAHCKPVYCIASLDPSPGPEGNQLFWHPDYAPWCNSAPPGGVFRASSFEVAFRAIRASLTAEEMMMNSKGEMERR